MSFGLKNGPNGAGLGTIAAMTVGGTRRKERGEKTLLWRWSWSICPIGLGFTIPQRLALLIFFLLTTFVESAKGKCEGAKGEGRKKGGEK